MTTETDSVDVFDDSAHLFDDDGDDNHERYKIVDVLNFFAFYSKMIYVIFAWF